MPLPDDKTSPSFHVTPELLLSKRESLNAVGLAIQNAKQYFPGLVLSSGLAAVSIAISKVAWFAHNGISALTLAIALGILVGNTVYSKVAAATSRGVTFSKQTLLRLGIVLYGLRLTFQDIGHVGIAAIMIDAVVLCSTFAIAWVLGTKVFKLDDKTAILIGAGSAICGAAAVMAVESVARARTEQVTVAVSTVVAFGTLGMFLYPALYYLNEQSQLLSISPTVLGLYIGATIHEVAQVTAAAQSIGADVSDTAVITKMVRVMMLAPFLIVLSIWLSRARFLQTHTMRGAQALQESRAVVSWFALGFIAMAALNSLAIFPPAVVAAAKSIDTALLATAMAALGLTSNAAAIRLAGSKPIILAACLFVWLVCGGFGITLAVTALVE
jgi:uncharacterized integral membrane protein (TIGR00698 family)